MARDRAGRALLFAALLVAGLAFAGGAGAVAPSAEDASAPQETRCKGDPVVVRSHNRADAADACRGARDAIAFLEAQGLAAPVEVTIEIAAKLPDVAGPSAAGCYLEREDKVAVLAYPEFREFGTWFQLRIDRDLYRSLIAHEVAHAVGACHLKAKPRPIAAAEYVAYVTMFATMPPDLRARALAKYPGTGFDREIEIDSTIYMLDPMRFGAQAYRHYMKPGNGREFLRAVVEGRAIAGGTAY
jgi:hypothetical protein